MKAKVFYAIPHLCDGCRLCELACSLAKTGQVNPYLGRIRVVRDKDAGAYPHYCRHCTSPPCLGACPIPEAMLRDPVTGAVAIRQEQCIGCLACLEACPFHAIWVGPGRELLKCDLCGGDPVCVRYCPPRPENLQARPPIAGGQSCLQYAEHYRVGRESKPV